MQISDKFMAELDSCCDYTPMSPVSNLTDLFLKGVAKCLPKKNAQSRYWTHIKDKDTSRCVILIMLPILGNIYIICKDYYQYKSDKIECNEAIEEHRKMQRMLASSCAQLAKLSSGLNVTAEQMMPASTEDQQLLWQECQGEDIRPLRQLLERGISPNFYHLGNTPLVTACQSGSIAMISLLIKHGAEVNTPDRMGYTPFAAACEKGNLEKVKVIYPYIQNINQQNGKGITPLMFAASNGNIDLITFLIEKGADIYQKAVDGSDAVTFAITLKDHFSILPLLFKDDENIDDRKYQFQPPNQTLFSLFAPAPIQNLTPLIYSTLFGNVNSAMYLLTRSDVRCSDSTNSSSLHFSVKHVDLLQALLEKCKLPEFVNQQNIHGSTALHRAIELDQPDAALLLLQSGADPFIADKENKIPVILACEKGMHDVAKYIEEKNKLDSEIHDKMVEANKIAEANKNKKPPEKGSILSAFSLLNTGLRGMQSLAEDRVKLAQKPRTVMEMIFGKLKWPY